ncbi:hypothetical protein [Nitrospira moscoviensis]|uniref:RiboL-PSP-HEPN domain-containing protein n=1 Tax=Nitrospira moscoviensis TaxID=42253 RepID=A0A0K2G9W7_NITMO|nr:hypothetical protein [Nitrospira moscoviensis]ALA57735.1 hypothetical protein NITMOv2_1307 [Nitrospira moscoviensis]
MSVSFLLRRARKDLDVSVSEARCLLDSCRSWKRLVGVHYRPILKSHVCDLAALSFFKIHLAWEEFLEEAFITLLVGAKKGTRGARSLLDVQTRRQAFEILKGERNSFVEWSVADAIRNRAKRFFCDGRPFEGPLTAGSVYIEQMRKIRNRIAHRSSHAEAQFRILIRDLYGAYKPETPGGFLLRKIPSNFSIVSQTTPITLLDAYSEIVRAMADNISR